MKVSGSRNTILFRILPSTSNCLSIRTLLKYNQSPAEHLGNWREAAKDQVGRGFSKHGLEPLGAEMLTFCYLGRKEIHMMTDVDALYFMTMTFGLAWGSDKAINCLRIFLLNRRNKQVEIKNRKEKGQCQEEDLVICPFLSSWAGRLLTHLLNMKLVLFP